MNLLRRVQIINKAHQLRFTKDFFGGGREGREGEKLFAILSIDMKTIDPESLHKNADLMTKPTSSTKNSIYSIIRSLNPELYYFCQVCLKIALRLVYHLRQINSLSTACRGRA